MNKNVILSGIAMAAFLLSGCGKHEAKSSSPFESEDMAEDMNSTLSNEVVLTPQDQTQAQNNPNAAPGATGAPEVMAVRDPSQPYVKPTNQEIQQSLKNAGFYTGTVDGVTGPRTKKAIRDFQEKSGLNADGRVGPQTWSKLEPYLHQAQNSPAVPLSDAPAVDN